jgi:hypothetical protein
MVAELADHLTDCPYELEIVNIDSDPELQSRYAGRIPLLMQDNVLVAEYVLDRDHLAALAGNRNFK